MGRATSGLMRSVTVHSRNLQQGSVIGGVIKTLLCHRLQFMGERRSEHYKLNLGWPWANSPTADAESLITESSIFIIRISISWRLRSCFSTRSKILPPGRHHKYHQQISHGSRRQLKKMWIQALISCFAGTDQDSVAHDNSMEHPFSHF